MASTYIKTPDQAHGDIHGGTHHEAHTEARHEEAHIEAHAETHGKVRGETPVETKTHYEKPDGLGKAMNGIIGWLARRGLSLAGSAELAVRGRRSGEWRRVPVNPLHREGGPFLVSARGQSEWVRNMRAAGGGRLQVGRRTQHFTAVELPDDQKPEILRAYLTKWGWQVARYFGDVTAESTDAALLATAHRHPVFRLTVTS